MGRFRCIFPAIIVAFTLCLAANQPIAAQSGSVNKSTKSKKTSSKSTTSGKSKRAGYDPVKNKIAQKGETIVLPMEFHGESEPLSELAIRKQPTISKENGKIMGSDREPLRYDLNEPLNTEGPESLLQSEVIGPLSATLGTSFEGPGVGLPGFTMTSAPPDTTMAVGPNHIVAWVNSQYAVFNKSGTVLLGPVNGNTLFSGLGNVCETTNRGDPILQYDRLANRWILSQFAFAVSSGQAAAPYFQCFAVSTTGDPTGTYVRYSVSFGAVAPSGLNDYGKLGIWNDAYYSSYVMFQGTPAGGNSGAALCASDRTKMLAGDVSATTLCAPIAFYGETSVLLPADLDGSELPTDTTRGGVFVTYSTQSLRLLRLKPDFVGSSVTITNGYGGATGSFITFPVGTTTFPCNGTGSNCVAQPGTATTLDTLGTRPMYRLAYRNRGGVDNLVLNQSVDPDGAGTRSSAVRWYEIRNPLGNPADTNTGLRPFLNQNGTYDPGSVGDRWMGSIATNKYGDILLGYSKADAPNNLKPSIAVAGRSQGDTLSALQAESIAVTGTGSQTFNGLNPLTRWGDYSTMQVDPADDETFWFTTEYLATDGVFNWRTRIVSYKFQTTIATVTGDFGVGANWSNGVPSSTVTGIIPTGRTMTVNTPSTIGSLDVQNGGSLVMNANLDVIGSLTLGTTVNTGANTLGLGCNATVSGAGTGRYVIGNVRKDYCAPGAFSYPTGSANGYSPANVNITTLTTNPSSLEIKANQGNKTGMDPLQSAQRFWTLVETGDLTANLTFNYLDIDIVGTESNYKLFRFVGPAGSAVTPFTLNTINNTISANGIDTFSDWTVGNLAPSAANVSVSGSVLTSFGRLISRAVVSITDQNGNSRSVMTNNFGSFRFNDIEVGRAYVISVISKSSQFAPQTLTVDNEITGLEIIGSD